VNVIVSHIYATKSTGVCWRFAVIGNEVPVRKETNLIYNTMFEQESNLLVK